VLQRRWPSHAGVGVCAKHIPAHASKNPKLAWRMSTQLVQFSISEARGPQDWFTGSSEVGGCNSSTDRTSDQRVEEVHAG
jgi:hypothetical protein